MTDTDHKTIHEALVAVTRDVQAVAKGDRNAQQGFNFRGIDAVMNAVGPAFRRHGVICTPWLESLEYTSATTAKGSTMNVARVQVNYMFHGPGGDGDQIVARVPGEAFDSGDKSTAKAMSVAYRTALLQVLTLPTDEPDPDTETYDAPAAPQTTPAEQWLEAINDASTLEELHDIYKAAAAAGAPLSVRSALQEKVAGIKAQQRADEVAGAQP